MANIPSSSLHPGRTGGSGFSDADVAAVVSASEDPATPWPWRVALPVIAALSGAAWWALATAIF